MVDGLAAGRAAPPCRDGNRQIDPDYTGLNFGLNFGWLLGSFRNGRQLAAQCGSLALGALFGGFLVLNGHRFEGRGGTQGALADVVEGGLVSLALGAGGEFTVMNGIVCQQRSPRKR